MTTNGNGIKLKLHSSIWTNRLSRAIVIEWAETSKTSHT